ncbi:MAG: hypothetical protein ACLF0G_16195 [Candidatus Brocadiia bacterium]
MQEPHAPNSIRKLLDAAGCASADELFAEIPDALRHSSPLRLPPRLAERDLTDRLLGLAAPNTHLDEALCFLGGGVYDRYVPAVVDAVAHAAGPQLVGPGSAQPLLQVVFELQAAFAALAGLEAAAAPLAHGPAALAEAVGAAARATGRGQAVLARSAHPRYRAIARTLAAGPSLEFREAGYHGGVTRPDEAERALCDDTACLVVQQPNYFGCLEDVGALARAAGRHGALLVVLADPVAMGVLVPPGEAGADIAVCDSQPLGSRPAYGSGSVGLLACRPPLLDHLGGWRVERQGRGFEALGATQGPVRLDRVVRPLAYLAAVGAEGLARAARLSMGLAHEAQRRVCAVEGFDPRFRASFFSEFVVESRFPPAAVAEELLESNILGGRDLQPDYPEMEHCMLFAVTERRTQGDVDMLCHALELMAETGAEVE